MFREVNTKTNFLQLEEDILRFWKEQGTFNKSIKVRAGGAHYAFYEGPPTANGSPGVHHVLSRLYKDVVCRYKTMKGYHVPRKAGWDTHGLPVELEVESSLALTSKAQIEEYGVARFNDHCRQSAFKYIKEWEAMTERLGCWLDMAHPYITLDNSYIESCWWIIKELWDKGLIYQGYKVTPHCPRCGTSLSSHEVALGYKADAEDPSVYVKFKVEPSPISETAKQRRLYELSRDKATYLLAWTTTPWTLPGNTALAVALDADYALLEVGDDYLILADALREKVGLGDYKVVEMLKGSDLTTITGVKYEPLYNPHQFGVERRRIEFINEARGSGSPQLKLQKLGEGEKLTYKVIAADFVSMEEGTGIVHVAPAFGEVDFEVGMHPGYCLDFVQPFPQREDYPYLPLLLEVWGTSSLLCQADLVHQDNSGKRRTCLGQCRNKLVPRLY